MRSLRPLALSGLLVVLVFLTIAVLFESGNDRPSTESGSAVQLVQAISDLRLEYFKPLQAAVSRADADCPNTLLTLRPPSCEAVVDEAGRLDATVLEVITHLETFDEQLAARADDTLVRGVQRNLELATFAHEFNVLLRAAWTESDQSKWDAAWDLWERLTTQLSIPEPTVGA